MLNVLKKWYDRNFHDEEAIILLLILIVSAAIIIGFGGILTPVIAALVLAFLLQGIVAQLEALRLPHLAAVSLSSAILVVSLVVGFIVLMPLALDQLSNLVQELPSLLVLIQERLSLLPELYPTFISQAQVQEWTDMLNRELGGFGQSVLSFSVSKIPNLFSFIIYLILVPVLVFFFLKDKALLLNWFGGMLPTERPLLTRIWIEMNDQMANYVRGKAIEMFIIGVASYIVFAWFGLNYAALLAILVGVSVIIPYIGAFIVTLPVLLVAFLQWGWGADFIWVMAVYFVIQGLDGNALVPLLFSEAVNLHPVAILLAILFFGGIWGLWGVFFAIPLATLIKAVLNAWPNIRDELPSTVDG
ncbi:MAG: AI-2E family transporter [Pseudomonadales bacterium]|nr:AI-2E family transporter [Pseudomonadales bacterium]